MFAHARIATTVFLWAALTAVSYRHAAADGTPVVFSNADEVELGRAERATILEQFGGEIPAAELRRYVESLGQLIARGVERKDVTFSFTVLDTPIVNAFATVGGYVYVTRGLVTLADSEAELAAMLAHALAHQARRDGVNAVAEVRLAGLRAATAQGPAEIGHVLAAGALVSFSREQEIDVDERAVRYLARSGHDTDGLARILTKLRRDVELEAVLRDGRPEKTDPFHFAAQHPLSNDRIERAARLAVNLASRDPLLARDAFLDKIDGLAYGDAPGRGFVRGRVFADPIRRIQFEAPPGFRPFITADGVTAFGPLGARMVFDSAHDAWGLSMPRYIPEEWARGVAIGKVEPLTVNGMAAATGIARGRTDAGAADVRLIAIRAAPDLIYRFAFATPPTLTASLSAELRRTAYSFRPLTETDARAFKPLRLRVHTVGPGDTVDRLAARLPFDDYRHERFEILNGLGRGAGLAPSSRVKIVTE